MKCDDYLAMLATFPMHELADGRAREHASTCAECNRVTLLVMERERHMLAAYVDTRAPSAFTRTAATALRTSRRHKVALYYRIGLGVTAVTAVLYTIAAGREQSSLPAPIMARETIRLQCLSPQQAAEVLAPYVRRTGSITIRPESPLGLIHIAASPRDVATAHKVLDRLDNPAASQCSVRVKVPPAP